MFPRISTLAIAVFAFPAPVRADNVHRVSLDRYGGDSNGHSLAPAISDSGTIVAFASAASDLTTEPDNNGAIDIFVREGFVTTRVSRDIYGEDPNGSSTAPAISGNGRFVVFQSSATNLVKVDTNGVDDIFACDRETGEIVRVNLTSTGAQAFGGAFAPAISGDGRFISFFTAASLIPEDTNGLPDVYVRDRVVGTIMRASVGVDGVQGNGFSNFSSLSNDGRFVAFQSTSSNLVAGDSNGAFDIFVRDRKKGTTERVSVDSSEQQYIGASNFPSISGNGRFVAFESGFTTVQIFVRDRKKGTTSLVSRNAAAEPGNSSSGAARISRDGKRVAFRSYANNPSANDSDHQGDVLVAKRNGKQMTLVSRTSAGSSANGTSDSPAIDATGTLIAFQSDAADLVKDDTNALQDVFVRVP